MTIGSATEPLACPTCSRPVWGRSNSRTRGPDVAWCVSCALCAEQFQGDLLLVTDQPDGHAIQFLRCSRCGDVRACRPGWLTACGRCLPERMHYRSRTRLSELRLDAELIAASVDELLMPFAQDGWVIQAWDFRGPPWWEAETRPSHGVWARHRCGRIAKATRNHDECLSCPPDPESRSHRARAAEPHYLYAVRAGRRVKFGRGSHTRIRTHQRSGAKVLQVLLAPFAEVAAAERAIKDHFAGQSVGPLADLPASFGAGTEVVLSRRAVHLESFLPDAIDVTALFA